MIRTPLYQGSCSLGPRDIKINIISTPVRRTLCFLQCCQYKRGTVFRRQRGRVVRAPDLKTGGCEFKSHSDNQLVLFLGSPEFNFSVTLVKSQLVRLLPVEILPRYAHLHFICFISCFHWPWKTVGEWSIRIFIYFFSFLFFSFLFFSFLFFSFLFFSFLFFSFLFFSFLFFSFILFYFILFYFILFYFILFYFILFYFILFYFILFYFILFTVRYIFIGFKQRSVLIKLGNLLRNYLFTLPSLFLGRNWKDGKFRKWWW